MMPQRRSRRTFLSAKTLLIHQEVPYQGQLENASLHGALASFADRIPVGVGDPCVLLIDTDDGETPLRLSSEIIHTCFTMVGVQFVVLDDETRLRLSRIVEAERDESLGAAGMEAPNGQAAEPPESA